MSTKFINLEDRIVTDTGEVVVKFPLLFQRCCSRLPYTNLLAEKDWQVEKFNKHKTEDLDTIEMWEDDGVVTGPADETYEWTIPQEYQELNIVDMAIDGLEKKMDQGKTWEDEAYAGRLMDELDEMRKRDMFPFVRCLIYVRDKFRKNKIVWGVGRGSSCASLVFYLLDINRVDPVKYGIPMEEFFKPEKITDEET